LVSSSVLFGKAISLDDDCEHVPNSAYCAHAAGFLECARQFLLVDVRAVRE